MGFGTRDFFNGITYTKLTFFYSLKSNIPESETSLFPGNKIHKKQASRGEILAIVDIIGALSSSALFCSLEIFSYSIFLADSPSRIYQVDSEAFIRIWFTRRRMKFYIYLKESRVHSSSFYQWFMIWFCKDFIRLIVGFSNEFSRVCTVLAYKSSPSILCRRKFAAKPNCAQ